MGLTCHRPGADKKLFNILPWDRSEARILPLAAEAWCQAMVLKGALAASCFIFENRRGFFYIESGRRQTGWGPIKLSRDGMKFERGWMKKTEGELNFIPGRIKTVAVGEKCSGEGNHFTGAGCTITGE